MSTMSACSCFAASRIRFAPFDSASTSFEWNIRWSAHMTNAMAARGACARSLRRRSTRSAPQTEQPTSSSTMRVSGCTKRSVHCPK